MTDALKRETHRLTLLQRQVMEWLKSEGGGCLPIHLLFATAVHNHPIPNTDQSLVAAKLCEAVEQLQRMNYVEVRDELQPKSKTKISLYDFAPLEESLDELETGWAWTGKSLPIIALSDLGSAFVL
ncbi:MAG: hypothetical protein ACRCYO_08645 [Bacteroidia bacterium]